MTLKIQFNISCLNRYTDLFYSLIGPKKVLPIWLGVDLDFLNLLDLSLTIKYSLVSYLGHFLGRLTPTSAEMQSVYSTVQAD